ncbi:putative conserved protein related to C-terminal domain of eukaryotic chaperone, SACSIN [Archaeoglobus sulfaticallidus PM70-1]|uniref:Putative conserved protein related to C-terminal domain of eukaryotic chaperone, SACSIN n=1 Tax=Archaeoglobus sulfaticallidus PM70-1 TaxID=387631 RepID=N0BI05_9EURY|nr:HEPN domain-containing protein [Archaeoglobus sulfaticallidus]AGK60061.1 putative conserved protein related to C-terminal domain of eukaryotic chaperone, SACSIN [Archaeoglobus sulfaticallidus PM70-1]
MDEITLRIKKAEKLLRDAESELKMGMYERCCSTAYYAMFHASKAMILSVGEDSRTHRGTIFLIWKNKEKLGLNEEDCIRLSKAFDLREESDYGIFQEISEETATDILKDAREFVKKAKEFLIS